MRLLRRLGVLIMLFSAWGLTGPRLAAELTDGPDDRMRYSRQLSQMLRDADYAGLRAEYLRLRAGERFPEGVWKLPMFDDALTMSAHDKEE